MRRVKDRIRSKKERATTSSEKKQNVRPGLYVIFVDTERTERNYFEGLEASKKCRAKIQLNRIRKTKDAIRDIQERTLPPRASVWLVFDRDENSTFDQIIADAEKEGYRVGWSNPCFEIWLHAYFGKMPSAQTSVECVGNFKREFKRRTKQEYEKNDPKIFDLVENYGKFERACDIAKKTMLAAKGVSSKPSEQSPATTVYELVEKLRGF